MKSGGATREYRQSARAEAAAQTATDVLDAALDLYWRTPIEELTLNQIAEKAGVTVQTVIRRFGGKDEVIAAVADRERGRVNEERSIELPGDVGAAIKILVAHYERVGEQTLKLLAEESRHPAIAKVTQDGRQLHRDWCETAFGPQLESLVPVVRRRRIAQLTAICDVYTWKILRRDSGLGVKQTEQALVELVESIAKGST